MKKIKFLFFFLSLSCLSLKSQSYNISTGTITTCSGTFYDDGGPSANYGWGTTIKQTFVSSTGSRLKFDFTSLNVQNTAFLVIHDGPNDSYPIIGSYGTSTVSIESTGSALTFVFVGPSASNTTRYSGWVANISCTTPTLTPYAMINGTITTCSGVFFDPSGAATNYSNSIDVTQTYKSGSSSFINFTFTNFSVALGDTLFVFDGGAITSPLIGAYTDNDLPEQISSLTGNALTFRFKSNASTNNLGWKALINCSSTITAGTSFNMQNGVRYVCSGTFYDDGGPSANYWWGSTIKQTFVSSTGSRLKFDFTSLNVQNTAFLVIHDGPNDSYPLIGTYGTSTVSIESTGSALTFVFTGPAASNTTRYSGWVANISCTTPTLTPYAMINGTITTCSGVFFDPSGAATNYSNSIDVTQTYKSGSSSFINFTFTNFSVALGDTLFVFDGGAITSPLIGAYTDNDLPEQISSLTGNALTFRFKSNASTNNLGWKALINCSSTITAGTSFNMQNGVRYVCSGTFYDDGGPSANYWWGSTIKQTFVSSTGSRLKFDFTSLNVQNTAVLRVYDGPDNTYPLIGTYGTSTVSIESTGSALTFVFTGPAASNTTRYSGWVANISCVSFSIAPVANFTVNPICVGQCINLTDASSGAPTNWLWQFSGASVATSTVQNPTAICYPTPGTYTLSSTVSNAFGSSTITKTITVLPTPTITISSTNTLLCSGQSATLIATGANTYTWSNGSTNNQIVITPTASTTYSLVGINGNGCSATASYNQIHTVCTSIANEIKNNDITYYPNPVVDELRIIFNNSVLSAVSIKLINILGKEIYSTNVTNSDITLDLKTLETGMYWFYIYDNSNTVLLRKPVIKQ